MKIFNNKKLQNYLRVPAAVKRQHEHSNSHNENISLELVCSSEVYSTVIMVGSVLTSRQTCNWQSSWEFYVWIGRQQEEWVTLSLAWASQTSKPNLSDRVIDFLQHGHNYSSKTTPPNSSTLYGPTGAISFKPLQETLEVFIKIIVKDSGYFFSLMI